jgi:hypothetical protein
MKTTLNDFEYLKRDSLVNDEEVIESFKRFLEDLEKFKLTEEVLLCNNIDQLYVILKNAKYLLINNELVYYSSVWIKIQSAIRISSTTIFHQPYLQKLNEIPHEYGLRSKTAELVHKMF